MDVMDFAHSPAVTCRPTTTLTDCARLMRDEGVGSVVVTSEAGQLVGIVTDRDIVVRGMADSAPGDTPISEVMSTDVGFVYEGEDLMAAGTLLAERACRRAPVLATDGHVVGLVALDDLLTHLTGEADRLTRAVASARRQGRRTVRVD